MCFNVLECVSFVKKIKNLKKNLFLFLFFENLLGAAIFLRVCLRNLLPHVFLGGIQYIIMKKWCVV